MVFMSILLITLMICLLFSNISSIARTSSNGGGVRYDEEKLQDYADGQYARAFGSSTAYEDNLLLVFLVDETYSDYYYIAWVGDHIATDINYMLGNNQTELGQAMALCINETSYKYSLDSNLAQVMETMTKEIEDLGLETSFKCSEDHAQVRSRLRNDSELDLNTSMMYRHEDYVDALRFVSEGKIQLKPLQSAHFAFRDYLDAYKYIDANRESTMKVLIDVDPSDD